MEYIALQFENFIKRNTLSDKIDFDSHVKPGYEKSETKKVLSPQGETA